jgi:putative ABC transport system permease protein
MSIVFIAIGYATYFSVLKGGNLGFSASVTLFMVVIGTFLFFSSFMYFVIKKKKNNESSYYKGLNMIATSQLLYRIKSNAKMLSVISILSATTLTAIGMSMTTYFMSSQVVDKNAPYSYTLKVDNKEYIKEFEDTLNKSDNHKLEDKVKYTYITLPSMQNDPNSKYTEEFEIIPVSKLNEILKVNGDKEIDLIKDNEFVHVYPSDRNFDFKSSVDINNNGSQLKLKLKSDLDKKLYTDRFPLNIVVVSDNVFDNLKSNNKVNNYYLYNVSNAKNGEEFTNKVLKLTEKYAKGEYKKPADSLVSSYYSMFKAEFTSSGILVFIGAFVGLVFLVCTGSVIFFKLLSEAQDEAPRYNVLEKIGVDDSDIKSSVYKQVGFNFFLPLLIGSIHSIVANYVICNMLGQNIMFVMACTLIPYSIIYVIYYLITSKFYFEIVTKKN